MATMTTYLPIQRPSCCYTYCHQHLLLLASPCQDLPAGAPPAVTVEVSVEDVTLIEEEVPVRAPRPLQLQHHHQPWAPLLLQLQRHRP